MADASPRVAKVGRYALYDELAAGGMATVHFGRLIADAGFARIVAVKRLFAHFAKDAEFAVMLLDEARLTGRVRHPNVVPTLDVVREGDELLLVMEYVHGESLAKLWRASRQKQQPIPARVVVAVAVAMLQGLHAAHEAKSEQGEPLGIVHRDVSPQNVIVGADGAARVLDFGVAKAAGRLQTTREGQLKGKPAYMSPEQLLGDPLDRRSDVFSASIVLWEILTGERLFRAESDRATVRKVLEAPIDPPSRVRPGIPKELDAVVRKGLARPVDERYPTAKEMAAALEQAVAPATSSEVAAWVESLASDVLAERAARIEAIERGAAAETTSEPSGEAAKRASTSVDREATQSQVSSVSVSTDARRRSRPVGFALGAVALALGVGAIVAYRGLSPSKDPASMPPPAVAPPPASVDVAPAAAASSAPPITPVLSASAPPDAKSRKSPPPPRARPACDPPYTLDARGIHHMKPECL